MKKKIKKLHLQQKKRKSKNIIGSLERPRLYVFRSNKHIYGQLINDLAGQTLLSYSTLNKTNLSKDIRTTNKHLSYLVGIELGKKAIERKISKVIFDRGRKPYHGRIQSLAEGARSSGLIF